MQSNIRIIELLRFLYQQTDEAHAVTVSEMIEYLKSKGIPSVRQTVYTDLEALDTAGIDIVQIKSTQNRYFIGSRIFEYTDEINTGNPLFYLIIKNFGKSPAYITKFESDFDFRGCYKIPTDKDYLGNLKNAVFAPGQSRICMLDYAKIGKEITFTLEYHSGAKKKYSEKFTIDLKAGVSMPYGKAATEGKELRTISYTLQEMLQKNL